MRPTLIALAGPSRSGKGTCAEVLRDGAQEAGFTSRERQLSGPGKQYVASAFRPEITEEEAVAWFDELKSSSHGVTIMIADLDDHWNFDMVPGQNEVPLQQYLQRMLQGARDRWGTDFWTDKLIPFGWPEGVRIPLDGDGPFRWWESFMVDHSQDEAPPRVADLALISDLRQVSEAERVKELGGYIIEMQRPPLEHHYVTGADHVTEQRLSDLRPDLVDSIIEGSANHNDETFAKLKQDCSREWEKFVRPLLEA